jgi:hypothetical protein
VDFGQSLGSLLLGHTLKTETMGQFKYLHQRISLKMSISSGR